MDALGAKVDLGPTRLNIAPTEAVPLLRRDDSGQSELLSARWWLTPHWSKGVSQKYAMFNARCEGLRKSPAFRKPFASQRGIVPMSSFIEWRGQAGQKQPWRISNDDEALAVAALWDVWRGDEQSLLSCTLVTTEAAQAFKPWHSRMPVMLDLESCERWLDNSAVIAESDLAFAPRLHNRLHLTPIDTAVGNARNKSADSQRPTGERVTLNPDVDDKSTQL